MEKLCDNMPIAKLTSISSESSEFISTTLALANRYKY